MEAAASTKQTIAKKNRTNYSFRVAVHYFSGLAPSAKKFSKNSRYEGERRDPGESQDPADGNNKDIPE
jgi:hypothetical protein